MDVEITEGLIWYVNIPEKKSNFFLNFFFDMCGKNVLKRSGNPPQLFFGQCFCPK